MRGVVLQALMSYWRRNPLQLFTLLAGLALATALWSGVQAINAEARASYDAAAATLGDNDVARIERTDGLPIAIADYVALRRAGWLVSPVVEGRLGDTRLLGIEPLTFPAGASTVNLTTADLQAGPVLWAAPDVPPIDGVRMIPDDKVAPRTAVGDIGLVSQLLGRSDIDRMVLAPSQPNGLLPLDQIVGGLVVTAPQGGSDIGRLTDSFHLNLTAFGLLAFAVGIFIVHGAIGLAFEQRRPMIRTLRALGVPLKTIVLVTGGELLILAMIAGAVGVVFGYIIAAALLPDVAATLRGLYGADVSGNLALRPVWWLSGMAIAVGGALIAGAGVMLRLIRMPLLASGQARAWAMHAGRSRMWQTGAALVLLLVALIIARYGQGLVAGFALLGAMLTGAALLLPAILSGLVAIAARIAKRPVAQWFWADTGQQLSGLSLALMALLLALAANVGVSTMVSSFRLTFIGFLDQRLASELYVTARDQDEAARLEQWLSTRVDAVLPIEQINVTANGYPAELYGPVPHSTYAENWRFLSARPDAWDLIHDGKGAAINEQLAYRAGLSLGDLVDIPSLQIPVVGIYGDYGNPVGQVIVGREVFKGLYPDSYATRYGLRLPQDRVAEVQAALIDDFGIPPQNTVDQAGIKALSLAIFERTFTVTGALNVLTLAVAGFAMLMSLLTLAGMRVPQLAPVWALGMTRRSLARIEVLRALMLALVTAVLAVPLGLALAWVLLAVVNVAAFGWRLPMFVFPSAYVLLVVQALVAGCLAAAWPAWRLARTPPADLLKVFANER